MNPETIPFDPIAVYRETVEELYAFVARRCGGQKQIAEDVTQETYLRFIAECKRGRSIGVPAAWLRGVAHNVLMDHYRRRRPVAADPVAMDAALLSPEATRAENAAVAEQVMWGLAGLKESWASILAAFHLDGRSVAAIAAERGVSERAVEGQLRRARLALRKRLGKTPKEIAR